MNSRLALRRRGLCRASSAYRRFKLTTSPASKRLVPSTAYRSRRPLVSELRCGLRGGEAAALARSGARALPPAAALTGDLAGEVKIKDGGQRLTPRPGPVSREQPPRVAQMTELSRAQTPAGGVQTEAAAS